jgi:hypothetical protein
MFVGDISQHCLQRVRGKFRAVESRRWKPTERLRQRLRGERSRFG